MKSEFFILILNSYCQDYINKPLSCNVGVKLKSYGVSHTTDN